MRCFSSRTLRVMFGAAACVLVFSGAARAQIFGYEFGPVGPRVYAPEYPVERIETPRRAIRIALEAQGYELISPLERNGPVFRARVEDVRGREFRVVVDARNGDVLERFPMRGAEDRDFEDRPPRPPADIGRQRFGDAYAPAIPRSSPRVDDYSEDEFENPQPRAALPQGRASQLPEPQLRQSQLPLPDDRRLAPGAKPTVNSAPKPDKPANKPAKSAAVAKKPAAPKADVAKPAQKPEEARAPAAAPLSIATAKAEPRNAFLRRPDAPQREPAKTEQPNEPAASRPAPRVVYPGPTGE